MLHGSWETVEIWRGAFWSKLSERTEDILSKGFNTLNLKEWTRGVIQRRDPLNVWYVHMDIDCRCKLWRHCVLFCPGSSLCRQLSRTLEQRIEPTVDYWKLNWECGQCGNRVWWRNESIFFGFSVPLITSSCFSFFRVFLIIWHFVCTWMRHLFFMECVILEVRALPCIIQSFITWHMWAPKYICGLNECIPNRI